MSQRPSALALSSSATPTPPGRNGLIAFVAGTPLASGGISVIRADGSGLRRLTHHPRDRSPAWSPDGQLLAFARAGHIYVMKADGTRLHRLGHRTQRGWDPAWSPDGRSIAFVTAHSLFVIRPDGGGVRRLYIGANNPSWSPDGRWIAFYLVDDDACEASSLMVIGRDGRGLRNLTLANGCSPWIVAPGVDGDDVDANDSDPDWSPDGTRIAFTRVVWLCERCDQEEIFSSDAEGNDVRWVTTDSPSRPPSHRGRPTAGANRRLALNRRRKLPQERIDPHPAADRRRAILKPIGEGGKPLMSVEVHVTGRVQLGHFAEFLDAAERWRDFRAARGHAPCRILQALSGEMNAVRLVFLYPDLNAYEQEEAGDAVDPDYARVAGAMPFVEGTLAYEIYREAEPSRAA